jgi:hypothetical protein
MKHRLAVIAAGLMLAGSLLAVTDAEASPALQIHTPVTTGYDMVGADGGVFVFGGNYYGSLPGLGIHVNDIVGIVPTFDEHGYYIVGSDGGVFAFGDATYEGSLPGIGVRPNLPIAGIVPSADDRGYFLVGADGGVFAFGDAQYEGSVPGLGQSISDVSSIAATPDNRGYWVQERIGTVWQFGTAPNLAAGSTWGTAFCGLPAGPRCVAIASTNDGRGYWTLDGWGFVLNYGDAVLASNAAGATGPSDTTGYSPFSSPPPVSIVPTSDDLGYWVVMQDGGIYAYGDAANYGSLPGLDVVPNLPIVGAVPTSST